MHRKFIDFNRLTNIPSHDMPNVVIKAVQSIFVAANAFSDDKDGPAVIEVLIQAVVNMVVK